MLSVVLSFALGREEAMMFGRRIGYRFSMKKLITLQSRIEAWEVSVHYYMYVHVSCICGPPYDAFYSTVVVYMYMYVDGILCKLSPAFLLSVILAIVKRVSG